VSSIGFVVHFDPMTTVPSRRWVAGIRVLMTTSLCQIRHLRRTR
jgi:hypothetical protein